MSTCHDRDARRAPSESVVANQRVRSAAAASAAAAERNARKHVDPLPDMRSPSCPALATSRLAAFQCWFAVLSNIAMPAGLAMMLLGGDAALVKYGSFAVLLATLLFVIMFVRKVALAKAA